MRNKLFVSANKITMEVGDPLKWALAKHLTGSIKELGEGRGRFEMALSAQNLNRIHRFFEEQGDSQPIIVSGKNFVDDLKEKLRAYKKYREEVSKINLSQKYPVPPNGKFYPYAHQTQIAGVMTVNPFAAIIADCGLGKTGASGRAIEMVLEKGEVMSGKILITAPLSILNASWAADLKKFTGLRSCVLWTGEQNKETFLSDPQVIHDFGEAPVNTISKKSKEGVWFKNIYSNEVKRKVDALDTKKDWERFLCSWKVAYTLDGLIVPFGTLVGRRAEKEATRELFLRRKLFDEFGEHDVYLTNHDSVRIYEDILKEAEFEWVLVDESSKIKSPESQVGQAHVDISWKAKRRNILTGTPNPNGFQDLWKQYYFLDRGLTLEPSYKDYLYAHFIGETIGRRVVAHTGKEQNIVRYRIRSDSERSSIVNRIRSVGVFLRQRDCIDLPERTDLNRITYMSDEQEQAYKSMQKDLVAQFQDVSGKVVEAEAVNALSKIMKLRQITSGFLIGKGDEKVRASNNPKLEDLDGLIDEIGDNKIVIVSQFREDINTVLDRYKDFEPLCIRGGEGSPEEKEAIQRLFQEDPKRRLLVVQPKAGGHGLTFTEANYLIYLSLDYDFDAYYQVAKRIERIGQKRPMTVFHSIAQFQNGDSTIDEDLLEVLHYKSRDRDAIFANSPDRGAEMSRGEVASFLINKMIERNEA